jgi:hypothetical protein
VTYLQQILCAASLYQEATRDCYPGVCEQFEFAKTYTPKGSLYQDATLDCNSGAY